MTHLYIKETKRTPCIRLNSQTGIFEIIGTSLSDEADIFYKPVISWIGEYAKKPHSSTKFDFKFAYLNVQSSKLILDILSPLKKVEKLEINWHYFDENKSMKEVGEDISDLLCIPFEYIMK